MTSANTQPSRTTAEPDEYRLLKEITPINYILTLRADFDPFSNTIIADTAASLPYRGEVTINMKAVESTNRIWLHMDRVLELDDPNILIVDSQTQQPVQIMSADYGENQLFEIQLNSFLEINKNYSMLIKFKGTTTKRGFIYHGYEESFQRRFYIFNFFVNLEF